MALPKIEHPSFFVDLPSNKKKVELRPMTIKEEKILLVAKEDDDDDAVLRAIVKVLQSCVVKETKIDDLPMFDIEWLFLKLRAQSVSNVVDLVVTESEEVKHDIEIKLDQVKMKYPKDVKDNIAVSADIAVKLKHPPVSLYLSEEYTKLEDGDARLNMMLVESIDAISGVDMSQVKKDELTAWVNDIPATAFEKINKFLTDTPRMEMVKKYKDSKGEEQQLVLGSLTDFFTL